jgi:tRNA pseudouridine38-40 synthase
MNALLPADIGVRAAVEAPPGFDPRRNAVSRWYRYTLHVGSQRPTLLRQFVWHVPAKLELQAMADAARCLVGRHDFAAFTQPSEARRRPTERVVTRAYLGAKGELALFDIEANAFVYQMVRRIVGALVEVGSGKRTRAEFEMRVNQPEPGSTAPAQGLCLMKVRYEMGCSMTTRMKTYSLSEGYRQGLACVRRLRQVGPPVHTWSARSWQHKPTFSRDT